MYRLVINNNMLKGYIKNKFGIIEQIDKSQKIPYDPSYSDVRYNAYGIKVDNMSHLRLGFILGSIGHNINSILDVGYGNGSFLKTCTNIIPKCYGADISGYPIPSGCEFVSDITEESYDVITFFDSLEHFEDITFIEKLKCKYICISLPWCHYYNDEWFDMWKHRRPNEHLFHFNDESLDNFFSFYKYKKINSSSNIEDTIRKSTETKNILTAIYKKL